MSEARSLQADERALYKKLLSQSNETLTILAKTFRTAYDAGDIKVVGGESQTVGFGAIFDFNSKYPMKGIPTSEGDEFVAILFRFAEDLIHKVSSLDTINPKDFKLDPDDGEKIRLVANLLLDSHILPDLDFDSHTSQTLLEPTETGIEVSLRKLEGTLYNQLYPVVHVEMSVWDGNDSKPMFFQTSKAGLRKLMSDLAKAEKDLTELEYGEFKR